MADRPSLDEARSYGQIWTTRSNSWLRRLNVNHQQPQAALFSRSKRGKAPRLFKEALFSVSVVYLLTHGVGLVDLWLYSSARAVSGLRSIPVEVESPYGITYNEAKCGPFNKTELPCQKLITITWGKWRSRLLLIARLFWAQQPTTRS